MERSYLVQRLQHPIGADPLSFGLAGLKNGGLSKQDFQVLNQVIRFDYMGSAEFEWGAIPEALNHIWDNRGNYLFGEITLHYRYKDWRSDEISEGNKTVYYVCSKEDESEVKSRLSKWALNDDVNDNRMKESLLFGAAMAGKSSKISPIVGWLELNNRFFFFLDKKMFEDIVHLFEIV